MTIIDDIACIAVGIYSVICGTQGWLEVKEFQIDIASPPSSL